MHSEVSGSSLVVFFDKFGIDVPLLCIQVINFMLVAYLLYRFGFRKVLCVMDERNKRISDGLEYAKKMEAELNEIDAKRSKLISEANSQADEIVSSAKNFATEEAEKQQEKSKKATDNMLAKARVDIANERNAIFIGLKSELKNLVVEVTKGVLQRDLSDAEKLQYGQHAVEILTKTA